MRNILLIWLFVLRVTVPCDVVAGDSVRISEDTANVKSLRYSEVSEVIGLYHPGLERYARLTGIDINRVVAALKLSPKTKGKLPAFIGSNNRYKTSGFRSVTAKVFELVPVRAGDKTKLFVLYNNQVLDENDIESFHRGWILAELSDNYELKKVHNLFKISKHPWPGGEAIYTELKIKRNSIQIVITYEQAIRGSELHTRCVYNFAPHPEGFLAFKGVKDNTFDGPMEQ